MKVKTIASNLPGVETVVLYTETKKEDYFVNHQLFLVPDTDDDVYEQTARRYMSVSDEAIVSDRQCFVNAIKVRRRVRDYE